MVRAVLVALLCACTKPAPAPAPASTVTTTVALTGQPEAAAPLVQRPPVDCTKPTAVHRNGSVPSGPAVQWVGEDVVDGHTMKLWDGSTLKPMTKLRDTPSPTRPPKKWRVANSSDLFSVDVADQTGAHVSTPSLLRWAEAESDLAIDEEGRVWNLATRSFVRPEPFTCAAPTASTKDAGSGWWVTKPSYSLSPTKAFEECNQDHRWVTIRPVSADVVTVLGDAHLTYPPNDAYVLVQPGEGKTGATASQKLTFDASGTGHLKILAHDATVAAGPTAYAVATRTELVVTRACDDVVIATVPLQGEPWTLSFSESGTRLLEKSPDAATVYELR